MKARPVVLGVLAGGLLSGGPPLAAQTVIVGTVRADSTGRPLSGVEVVLVGSDHRTATDNAGRYLLSALPSGRRQVLFRSPGFRPVREWVELGKVDTVWVNPSLTQQPVELDSIVVTGRPDPPRGRGVGREAFEERRKLGFGIFLDSTVMRRNEHRTLTDLLRGRRGILIKATSAYGGGYIVSSRLSMRPTDCFMQVYLDGMPYGRGGVGGQSSVNAPNLKDFEIETLEAVEVYPGAGAVPLEYGGPSAQCGVVLLWSKRP